MPELLQLLIIWTSQQDYRWTFSVFIIRWGNWGLSCAPRKGNITKLWRQSLELRSESVWHPCFHQVSGQKHSVHELPCTAQKYTFLRIHPQGHKYSGSLVMSEKYAFITHSPGDCPTGGPQTKKSRWLRMTDSLLALSPSTFSSGRRGLQCYLRFNICLAARHMVALSWVPVL